MHGFAPAAAAAPRSSIAVICAAGDAAGAAGRDRADGIALGADEAARTAALLGRQIAVERLAVTSGAHAALGTDVSACVAGIAVTAEAIGALERATDGPILAIDPAATGTSPRLFRIRAAEDKTEWLPSLERYGAGELNERFARRFGRPMNADAWAGWVAVKAATEAVLRTGPGTAARSKQQAASRHRPPAGAEAHAASGKPQSAGASGERQAVSREQQVASRQLHAASETGYAVTASLAALRFDGHKGVPLWFDEHRVLVQPVYEADPARARSSDHAP